MTVTLDQDSLADIVIRHLREAFSAPLGEVEVHFENDSEQGSPRIEGVSCVAEIEVSKRP